MGADVVAVDATCARAMGIDPIKVAYLEAAGQYLGNLDARYIDQRGERPERFRQSFDLIESLQHLRLEG